MNLLFSCIGQRGYIADFFRPHLASTDRIIGTGNSRWTPGFKACDAAFLLPEITDEEYLPALLELCEREGISAILSFLDPDVYRLARAEEEFRRRGIIPLLPNVDLAEIAFDKYRMFEFLTERGIPTPLSAITLEEAAGFRYPLYVKPRRGSASRNTFIARNNGELGVFFAYEPDMMIQEAVVGEEFDIELCGDLRGRPVGISTWRKFRSRLGETEQAQTFRDPEVIDFGLSLGEALAVTGPMDVDVIRQEDRFVVLEANTRFGGGYPVSHLAGADFPRLLVELVKHGEVEPHFGFEGGVVMMKRLEIMGGPADEFFGEQLKIR